MLIVHLRLRCHATVVGVVLNSSCQTNISMNHVLNASDFVSIGLVIGVQ